MGLKDRIEQLLSSDNLSEVLEIVDTDSNKKYFEEKAPQIIGLIFSELKHMIQHESFDLMIFSQLLELLTEYGNPKHVLEALVDGLNFMSCEKLYKYAAFLLVEPISMALQKIPGKRGNTLEHILNLLYSIVSTSHECDSEDDEEDGEFVNFSLNNYFSLFVHLVGEVSLTAERKKRILYTNRFYQQRELLKRYLIMLGYRPLLYEDHHDPPCYCDFHDQIISELFGFLGEMFPNIFDMFDWNLEDGVGMEEQADFSDDWKDLALGNLAYLMYTEDYAESFRPYVYQHRFLFKKFIGSALLLMENDDDTMEEKGFWLFYAIVKPLSDDQELTTDYFSIEQFTKFCRLFLTRNCLWDLYDKENCDLIKKLVSILDHRMCYHFLLSILKISSDVRMHNIAIYSYSHHFENIWGKPGFEYFLRNNLLVFLQNCVHWKDRKRIDVLYEFKSIIFVCELIRNVAKRDPQTKNISGLWDFYPVLVSKLLRPFTKSIAHTRSFCKKFERSPKGIVLQDSKFSKCTNTAFAEELKMALTEDKYTVMHFKFLQDILDKLI